MIGVDPVSMNSSRDQIVHKLADREYRESFVADLIYSHIPLKIRALREQRAMTQAQLGQEAGMAQTWVSKLEDPNYGKLTIATLLKLASAFDVGLVIDFVPYSRLLDNALSLSPESFEVASFENDQHLAQEDLGRVTLEAMTTLPAGVAVEQSATWNVFFNEATQSIVPQTPHNGSAVVAYSQAQL